VNAAADGRRPHYFLTLFALATGAMAFALSQTLVSPALPLIQRELHTDTTTVTFLLTAYLLAASVATPIVGRLGDMFGKERMLLVTLGSFGLGSLISGLATSIQLMIVGRVVQGVGGAIFPLAFGIIRDEFPREKVAAGIGLISATFGIGGGVGLILSGLIVDNLSYHWVFWVGLIVVALALLATALFVPESPVKTPAKIDWTGAGLLSGGLITVLIALSEGNRWGWLSLPIVWLFAAGFVLLVLLAWFEPRHPEPLVDMRMLARRAVLAPNVVGFLVGFGMFGSFILIPQFVQIPSSAGYGFSASVTQSGLFMLPWTVMMFLGGPLAGWLGGRTGSKSPLVIGTATMAVSYVFLAGVHHDRWAIYVGTSLLGIGIGFAYAAMANLIIEAVPQAQTGAASGINTIMRTIGGTLGGQIAASLITSHISRSGLPKEAGFTAAFAMSAAALALAGVAALTVPGRLAARRPAAVATATAPPIAVAAVNGHHRGPGLLGGVVRTVDGARVPGAIVVLLDGDGSVVRRTSTDAGGAYEFGEVRGAGHTVVAVADGCGPAANTVTAPRPVPDLVLSAAVPAS